MQIEKIEAWRIGDKVFFSESKAVDHAESTIHSAVKKALLAKGFTESECFKVTESLLSERRAFACLLAYGIVDLI